MLAAQKIARTATDPTEDGRMARPNGLFLAVFGVALLYTFLLSLELLTRSISQLAGPLLTQVMQATANPLVGVCIGLLVTATLQSSSAVTSILVALVSAGAITLDQAIPMVMGANIGTTFTVLLVALSHISSKKEFRKGAAAGLLHIFFNLGATLLLYPLEVSYHLLGHASQACAQLFHGLFGTDTGGVGGFFSTLVAPIADRLVQSSEGSWLWVLISFSMLFGCILLFRTVFRILWMRDYERRLNDTIFSNPWLGLGWGAGLTAFIHSSTVTTTLCVPLAATGAVSPRKLVHFIIGANIGTTITALMAAVGRSETALALAFSHFLFNFLAGAIVFAFPPVSRGLVESTRMLSRVFVKQRILALVFLVTFFFALPLAVLFVSAR